MAETPEVEREARVAVFGELERQANGLQNDMEPNHPQIELLLENIGRALLLIARALIAKGP